MKEQMEKGMEEIIKKTRKGLEATVTFLSAEIPDVIHQLLLWYAVKYGTEMLFSLALLAGLVAAIRWGWKKVHTYETSRGYQGEGAYFAFGGLTFLIGTPLLLFACLFMNM